MPSLYDRTLPHSPRIQLKALIFIYRSYLGPALKYLCDTTCQPIPLASCHLFNLWMDLIFLSLVRGLSCFNPKPLLALALHSGMSSLLQMALRFCHKVSMQ